MKIIITLIALTAATIGFGQKLKKVVNKIDNSRKSEKFYVLASDKTIKHGPYKIFREKDVELVSGYYKFGVKDSLWVEYDWYGTSGGRIKRSEGNYSNNQKVGIWKFYTYSGELIQEYDFTNKRIVSTKESYSDDESVVIIDEDTLKVELSSPVGFIGSSYMFAHYLNEHLDYPHSALENSISGKVIVTFYVDSEGKASDHAVKSKIGGGLDEAALEAVMKIPNDWIPGTYMGKPVKVLVEIPVSFQLYE